MEIDPSQSESVRQKSEALIALSNGPLSSSISKLTESSRVLPSEKDFHFYYNFDEFRAPIDEIGAKSGSILEKIGSSSRLWGGKELGFPKNAEEDGCDWLIDVNDNVFERIDESIEEENNSRVRVGESNGLVVSGKKKVLEKEGSVGSTIAVRVAERDKKTVGPKSKIPFHIATIRRPQDEYNILVNNGNQPFQHVWLERSEDGSRVIHPLEKVSFMDFVDRNIESLDPVKPPPLESTPFKLVEEVKDLKDLAAKLRNVNEFAVDLEHNQYRSFQGLTCLMQISTRTEDFVVDTLKLRIHIGPYLREVFKDPNKRKVMHGADRDIAWLQRDFGIYVCNLFDTGQASRVLQMERYSLEHLLQHFCEVAANKQYQNADWRLRPLPEEMMRYAREDTHYLLHIYDLMKIKLLSESTDPENSDALLLEVYKRSYDVCIQLYEKELLTDTSYLHIYGVQGANLNAQQLSIVAGLYEWRDTVARAEDESTGYVLPNKTLLEIAKQMPLTTNKLRRILKSKLPFVDRNLAAVVGIIRHSVQNASAFETVAQKLKEDNIQGVPGVNDAAADFPEARTAGSHSGDCSDESQFESEQGSFLIKKGNYKHMGNDSTKSRGGFSFEFGKNGNLTKNLISDPRRLCSPFSSQRNEINAVGATVKLLRKPNCAFGALLGSSASKKTNDLTKEKGENQLEQIRSSVNLPFRSFSHTDQQSKQPLKPTPEQQNRASNASFSGAHPGAPALATDSEDIILLESDRPLINRCEGQVDAAPASSTKSEDIVILLDSDSSDEEVPDSSADDNNDENMTDYQEISAEPELVILDDDDDDDDDEQMSLSDLSSSFQKCLQPRDENQSQTMKDNGELEEAIPLKFKQVDNGVEDDEVEFVE